MTALSATTVNAKKSLEPPDYSPDETSRQEWSAVALFSHVVAQRIVGLPERLVVANVTPFLDSIIHRIKFTEIPDPDSGEPYPDVFSIESDLHPYMDHDDRCMVRFFSREQPDGFDAFSEYTHNVLEHLELHPKRNEEWTFSVRKPMGDISEFHVLAKHLFPNARRFAHAEGRKLLQEALGLTEISYVHAVCVHPISSFEFKYRLSSKCRQLPFHSDTEVWLLEKEKPDEDKL